MHGHATDQRKGPLNGSHRTLFLPGIKSTTLQCQMSSAFTLNGKKINQIVMSQPTWIPVKL